MRNFLHTIFHSKNIRPIATLVTIALILAIMYVFERNRIVSKAHETTEEHVRLSHLDEIFINSADSLTDWKLLAAIAYVESKFDTSSVSHQGAIGPMQMMPATYRQMLVELGFPDTTALSARLNVMAAAQYIQELDDTFKFINAKERINFVLGSYNCGYGHIFDAMRLAKKQGINRYKWKNIESVMLTMNQEKVYTDSVCLFGKFDARETTSYVRKVNKKYNEYLLIDSVFKAKQTHFIDMKTDYEAYYNN